MTQHINDNNINNVSILDNSSSFIEVEEQECSIQHIPNFNTSLRHFYFPPQPPISIPDTESLFISQKLKIKSIQHKSNYHPPPPIPPSQSTLWEIAKFTTETLSNNCDNTPLLSPTWTPHIVDPSSVNQFNITNSAIRTICEVDYLHHGISISLSFSLEGESHLWIFTRSFVNKDNNDSSIFDSESKFVSKNQPFNKYTPVIIIMKEDKGNKCSIEFGTFCELPECSYPCYKTFHKRQLIDSSSPENRIMLLERDICYFNINILDYGNEKICVRTIVNNSTIYNDINANFFIPCTKKGKVTFAGNGQNIEIHKMHISPKDKYTIQQEVFYTTSKQTCSCCSIY